MSNRFFSIILFFALLTGCHSPVERKLIKIDSMLNQQPDSALSALRQIDTSHLIKNKDKAYYALLVSAAYDKNYIDVIDNTLIVKAVDYYSMHRNRYNRMRSYYYQGLVSKNAGNYPSAIVSFEQAEQDASTLQDLRFMGLIHRNIGSVFNITNNFSEAIKHNKKAITYFADNKDSLYALYTTYSLAVNYMNNASGYLKNNDLDSCLYYLSHVMASNNESLHKYSKLYYARALILKRDSLQKAIDYYRTVPKNYFSIHDYGYYALAHAFLGQIDSAQKWITIGERTAQSQAQLATLNSLSFRIDSLKGNYKGALHKVRGVMATQDSVTRILLQQSLSVAQKDYFQHEATIQKGNLQKQRMVFTFSCIILILLFIGLSLFIQIRRREKENVLKEQMAHLALEQVEMRKENGSLVGALFMERIARLCGLSNQYYLTGDDKEKKEYLSQFKMGARELNNTHSLFNEIEKNLDQYCSGIMSKLLDQVPEIKGTNRKIIALFFAGIPDSVIQIIMNRVSTGSLRTLRSRLRQTIIDANASDEELFLNMLAIKKQPGKKTKK